MRNSIIAGFLLLLIVWPSFGGQLSRFEHSVSSPASDHSSCEVDDETGFWGSLLGGCLLGTRSARSSGKPVSLEYGLEKTEPVSSATAETGKNAEDDDPALSIAEVYENEGFRHRNGTMGLPYVRFDYRWQYLDSQLDAQDYLLEVGYKYLAGYGRTTDYKDRSNGEALKIDQYYGMLRFGGSDDFFFPGSVQIGAGLGGYIIRGEQTQSGAALTLPVTIHPADFIGFEFRPAWTSINHRYISDYDVSMSLGYLYLQGRIGYRWLWVQHEGHWLNGPYAGVSLSF